jgi:hypothetical protein
MFTVRFDNVLSSLGAAHHETTVVWLNEHIPPARPLNVVDDFSDGAPLPGTQPGVFASWEV